MNNEKLVSDNFAENRINFLQGLLENEVRGFSQGMVGVNMYGFDNPSEIADICDRIRNIFVLDDCTRFEFENYYINVDKDFSGTVKYKKLSEFSDWEIEDLVNEIKFCKNITETATMYITELKDIAGYVDFMKDCGFEVENESYWQIIAKGSNGNVFIIYPMDFIESVKQNGYAFKPSSEAGNPVEAKANEYWIKYFYNKILDF